MTATPKKREILTAEVAFSLACVALGLFCSVLFLQNPNLQYREFALIISGALLGFGSLAAHEFLVGAPERAGYKADIQALLGPTRNMMTRAFCLGFYFVVTYYVKVRVVGATKSETELIELIREKARQLHVLEPANRLLRRMPVYGTPFKQAVSCHDLCNDLTRSLIAEQEGKIVQAATCGYDLGMLRMTIETSDTWDGKDAAPSDREVWGIAWDSAKKSYIPLLSNARMDEKLIKNTSIQMDEFQKNSSLLAASNPYVELLMLFGLSLDNDMMEIFGVTNFLRTCRIQHKEFVHDAESILARCTRDWAEKHIDMLPR